MNPGVLTSVDTPTAPDRASWRESRYAALALLWQNSQLARVRACRLVAADADAGVTLRRWSTGTASWVGLQSCGSTWACPVCSEKIAAERQAEIASALAVAQFKGYVVGFLTFTVRHRRRHSLRVVWDNVSDAWRGATSGNARRWNADRDRYGIVGYLRLWEVTQGSNGWHVHVHCLVFLDPAGRTITTREQLELVDEDFIGPTYPNQRRQPIAKTQAMPRVKHLQEPKLREPGFIGPMPAGSWSYRRQLGPVPAAVLVPDTRESCRGPRQLVEVIPAAAAQENLERDLEAGLLETDACGSTPARATFYRRDVEALAQSMFERWCSSLPAGMVPDEKHGWDARIVTDAEHLADYFAKNVYGMKSSSSAAYDVVGSASKVAKNGNRTPFGILAALVDGTAQAGDEQLWAEWETVSRGRRQLRWSEGMRDLLGLGEELVDEELVSDELEAAGDESAVDFATVDGQLYRRLAFGRVVPWSLELAEQWADDLVVQLLDAHALDWGAEERTTSPPSAWDDEDVRIVRGL